MAKVKRATIYLDPTLHRALRVKAAETETSVSDLVNGAVRQSLGEDAADLAVFEARAREAGVAHDEGPIEPKQRRHPSSPMQKLLPPNTADPARDCGRSSALTSCTATH